MWAFNTLNVPMNRPLRTLLEERIAGSEPFDPSGGFAAAKLYHASLDLAPGGDQSQALNLSDKKMDQVATRAWGC